LIASSFASALVATSGAAVRAIVALIAKYGTVVLWIDLVERVRRRFVCAHDLRLHLHRASQQPLHGRVVNRLDEVVIDVQQDHVGPKGVGLCARNGRTVTPEQRADSACADAGSGARDVILPD
jgi:hypothetical protein